MYHAVNLETNNVWCVPLDNFEKQMETLYTNGYTTILPQDIIAFLKWRKPLPKKPVMITFDDGYLYNLTFVEPILKRYEFKAVVFLITSLVGENENDRKRYENHNCLAWKEIQQMQQRGTFIFGGHSHDHINLAVANDYREQITMCKRELEKHKIRKPYTFCYPGGQYNEKVIDELKSHNFIMAMACKDEIVTISNDMNLFSVPRVSVMGGKHNFVLLDVHLKTNKVTGKILHTGVPIPILAKLYIQNCAPLVLSNIDISDGVFELEFVLPHGNVNFDKVEKLEIWDKHSLFLLTTFKR